MAKQRKKAKHHEDRPDLAIEEAFQALPPLGSLEYLAHIQSTPATALPPEVLARAFRQLPPDGEAAKATLARLLQLRGEQWDYLGPLVAYARRQSAKGKRDSYEDMLQDAVRRIIEVLPTIRGAYAESSWHSYCRRELSEAWRERYGRRGERFPLEEPIAHEEDDKPEDLFAVASERPPWHSIVGNVQIDRIEEIARRVVDEIDDDFVRSVAYASWFANQRPKVSGRHLSEDGDPPLTSTFKGKSRHQITRAMRHADSQLAAALLSEDDLEWTPDVQALLEKLRGSRRSAEAFVREP
jgi:hypothetical protein